MTWFDNLPQRFTFLRATYRETCGFYGGDLEIYVDDDTLVLNGEWGCTGGIGQYLDLPVSGVEVYETLLECGYDRRTEFDREFEGQRERWLRFLDELDRDSTRHGAPVAVSPTAVVV